MTKNEAAIVTAYTGILIGEFNDAHEYIEKAMGRPVFTHELADSAVMSEIQTATRDDFVSIGVV